MMKALWFEPLRLIWIPDGDIIELKSDEVTSLVPLWPTPMTAHLDMVQILQMHTIKPIKPISSRCWRYRNTIKYL